MHMNVNNNKLQAYNIIMRFLEAYFKLRDLDAVLKCVSEDVYSVGTGTDEAVSDFGERQLLWLLPDGSHIRGGFYLQQHCGHSAGAVSADFPHESAAAMQIHAAGDPLHRLP